MSALKIDINDEILENLTQFSNENHISMDKLINEAIKEYNQKIKLQKKQKALEWLFKNQIQTNNNDLKIIQKVKSENFY